MADRRRRAAAMAAAIALGALVALGAACHRKSGAASVGAATPPDAATAARTCGALACERFASPDEALARVLEDAPRVLAVGESHAQKGMDDVPSATKRFAEMLPVLAPRASDLVVELWVAAGKCGAEEAVVAERQKTVAAPQAASNQDEFVALGAAAKKLGIAPHPLVPSCDEYARIARAGEGDVEEMLRMIARRTARMLGELVATRPEDRTIVAYGGAMHNDLAPRPGREAFSFGPELAERTAGRYVELDLVVPEAIRDDDVWRALPWYAHFDRAAHGAETLLLTLAPGSYVLVFPKTR